MKKALFKILILCVAICSAFCVFAACGGGTNIELSFIVDNEIVQTVKTTGSELIEIPDDPEKAGYTFDGWYLDKETWNSLFSADSLLNTPISIDISVYAKFTAIEYTATFIIDGEQVGTETFTVEDNNIANVPEIPDKTGYTSKWENCQITAENITVNAVYTPINYSISFENTKGAENNNKTIFTIETEDIDLSDISKEGYSFNGWYIGQDKIEKIEQGTIGDKVLTANWTPIVYSATFIVDGEQIGIKTFTLEDDEIANIPKIPEKTGYTSEWEEYSIKPQNITVNAVYTIKKFTVIWKNYDGTVLKTDNTVEYNTEPTYNGDTPIKDSDSLYNYTFDDWSPEIVIATEDAEYTAQFKASASTSFTIKYDANGGTGAPNSQTKTKGTNITLSNTVPTNGNHVFMGWQCVYDGNTYNKGATFSVDANVILYAVWGHSCEACNGKGNTTCHSCKGEGKIRSGTACSTCNGSGQELMVICANCHKTRFVPGTWKNLAAIGNCPSCGYNQYIWGGTNLYDSLGDCRTCGGSGGYTYSTCSNCRGNGVLTCATCNGAKYLNDTVRSYTVTLKNGNDTFASQSVSYGLPYKFSVPIKTGYNFIGWFDSADGGNQYTDSCGVSFNVWSENNGKTLYGHWQINKYTITFNSDCNDYFEPITQDYNTSLVLPTNLTKEGKSFAGWFDATFTTEYTFTAMPAENLTLYAKWIEYAVILTCDESPAISVNSDINSPAIYHATAVDTDGNPATVTVQLLEGIKEAGKTVVVRIIAVGKNEVYTAKIISNIKVYGMPTLDYVVEKDYFNLSETLTADYFSATATDTFGEDVPVSVSVKESGYQAGDIVTLIISATDKAGNEINAEVKNIKAYGTPVITRNTHKNDMKVTDIISNDLFGVSAADSFGEELTVTTELESGTVSDGNTVIVKSSATDSKGNVGYITYSINVYGLPKIGNASKTAFKVEDEITLSTLGIIAKDSFNNVLDNVNLELTDGEQIAGATLTYLVTAIDHLGNVYTKTFDNIKIYGTPSITFDTEKTAMKVTDAINAALLSATAKDSHNGNLSVSVTIESGTVSGGNIVTLRLTATDLLGNEYFVVSQNIKVYSAEDINLLYNSALATKIKKISKGEEFGATATDSFGESCTLSIKVAAGYTLTGGNTVNLYIIATDAAGNTKLSELITGINVYDTPTLTYARETPYIQKTDSPYVLFSLKDSFGKELLFDVEIVSGSLDVNDKIVYRITGTDRLGNGFNENCELYVLAEKESLLFLYHNGEKIGEKRVLKGEIFNLPMGDTEKYGWYFESVVVTNENGESKSVWNRETGIYYIRKIYTYLRNENNIYFGEYPQSEVTDINLKDALNSAHANIIDSDNGWINYNYYTGSMWYKDVEHIDGCKYRAVYINSYRKLWLSSGHGNINDYPQANGYDIGNIYWFKFEPIKWRILSENGGNALLFAELAIDSQPYYYHTVYNSKKIDNKYDESSIRAWLNENFYNVAFNELQKEIIRITNVDNSARSTNPENNATQFYNGYNPYECNNTNDKVFLLSMQEITNATYGFNSQYGADDILRQKEASDYAKCQGVRIYNDTTLYWWLRSPHYLGKDNDLNVFIVYYTGISSGGSGCDMTCVGIVPALTIML